MTERKDPAKPLPKDPAPSEKGAGSAKQSMGGPSAKPRAARPKRGLLERAATAFGGGGTGSDDAAVRNAATAERLDAKVDATEALVSSMPENVNKRAEYALRGVTPQPPQGATAKPENLDATASTITESNESSKNGAKAAPGANPNNGPLRKHRVDSLGRALTTNQGVPVGDNQHSLRAGLRGPTLLEDFILREKITHFDHERIPERVVHARGSGAHGYVRVRRRRHRAHQGGALREGGQAHARLRALLDRGGRARQRRHRARRARFRRQILHRRGQLGLGRQQHTRLLHSRRDEVPRRGARGQARAPPPDAASVERARHVLGLYFAHARVGPHDHVADERPGHPPQLSYDAGLRRAHVPARQRGRRGDARQVPLDAGARHALARSCPKSSRPCAPWAAWS
jgi:hypothetical protein